MGGYRIYLRGFERVVAVVSVVSVVGIVRFE